MRLFETEFYVFNRKLEELTGVKGEDVPLKTTIDLDKIVRIAQWTSDDESLEVLPGHCMVYMDGEGSILVGTPYDVLVKAWKEQLQ